MRLKFIFIVSAFFLMSSVCSGIEYVDNEEPEPDDLPPLHKCQRKQETCVFSNVKLTLDDYEWRPTTERAHLVKVIKFVSSVIPVVTSNLCDTFVNLEILWLHEHIDVQEIHENAFRNCTKLRHLFLYTNQIKKLHPGTFRGLTNLEHLDLGNNQLVELTDTDMFVDLHKLTGLTLHQNNFTEFSPMLLRNNVKLTTLWLHSNDLLDLKVEEIVKLLPDLKIFYWDDNQISCARAVEAINFVNSREVLYDYGAKNKVRYYPMEKVFGNFKCVPDISWMASQYYKKHYSAKKTQKCDDFENGENSIGDDLQTTLGALEKMQKTVLEEMAKINEKIVNLEELVNEAMQNSSSEVVTP